MSLWLTVHSLTRCCVHSSTLLQTCCVTQSSVVTHNGGHNFVVTFCCHHCCLPVSIFSRPQGTAPYKAYRKYTWSQCLSYLRNFTGFNTCSTAQWVQFDVVRRTVIWTICHYSVSTCSNVNFGFYCFEYWIVLVFLILVHIQISLKNKVTACLMQNAIIWQCIWPCCGHA
jgi:hypothetical protein